MSVPSLCETPSLRETMLLSHLTVALIDKLQFAWPVPIDIVPSTLGITSEEGRTAFLEAVHGLVDDGLVMIEALLVGAGEEPVARQAALTRKGATVLHHVTRPM